MTEKINRTFVRKEAYIKLREWILNGTLPPGMKLNDKKLASSLGVSRTPIREAILRLEDEGLIRSKPNRSTEVSSIDFHSAFHLYSIVWTLETLAMTQAFGSIKEHHLQAMVEANETFLTEMKNKDRLAALHADSEFHATYVRLCGNEELEKIISNLKFKLKRLDLYYFEKIQDASLSYQEHQAIIEALKQRDLQKTLDAIEANWKNSFARFKL